MNKQLEVTISYMLKQEDGSYLGQGGPGSSRTFYNITPPIPRKGETVFPDGDEGWVVEDVGYTIFPSDEETPEYNHPWVSIDLYLIPFVEEEHA